jgi:hypothetical protein
MEALQRGVVERRDHDPLGPAERVEVSGQDLGVALE